MVSTVGRQASRTRFRVRGLPPGNRAPMGEGERQGRRVAVDRSEGFGERLLGILLDRAHEMPPDLIAPLVAEEAARIGGRDVSILLQD
jgi:hypothetical protein